MYPPYINAVPVIWLTVGPEKGSDSFLYHPDANSHRGSLELPVRY